MKVSALIPLILSTAVLAGSRRARNAIADRQVQLKRSLLDVCVALDLDLDLLDILPKGEPLLDLHLDICLCLSVLPDFLSSNSVAQQLVGVLGEAPAHNYFANLINSQPNKQQCSYPDNCQPICEPSNPCHWNCKDGYAPDNTDNPTKCVCHPPYTECNGKCGSFPHGCGSQTPHKKRRAPTCSVGKTLCGIVGGSKGKGYDCTDILSDPLSCGGCLVESPFNTAPVKDGHKGKKCSDILHVEKVACDKGSCKVLSCEHGFKVSSKFDSCEKDLKVRGGHDLPNDILDVFVKACIDVHVLDLVSLRADLVVLIQDDDFYHRQHYDFVGALIQFFISHGHESNIRDIAVLRENLRVCLSADGVWV